MRLGRRSRWRRIRFVGFDPQPEARLPRWRLLLLTCLHEWNPISVLEALAWGTPVLSAPLPGVAEMLAGRGAGCFQTVTPDAAILRRVDHVATRARASAQARARLLKPSPPTLLRSAWLARIGLRSQVASHEASRTPAQWLRARSRSFLR